MNIIDDNYPQFIKIDREIKEKYLDPLINTPSSQFYKREQGEVYFIAAAIGFNNKIQQKTSKNFDVRTYNGLKDQYKLFIRIIALTESKFDYGILKDGSKVLKIIEQYANGGMAILYDKIFSSGADFSLEDELFVKH